MIRQLFALLFVAVSASAFQVCNYNQQKYAHKVTPVALNTPLDVKGDFSGPSFKVGLDENASLPQPEQPKASIVMVSDEEGEEGVSAGTVVSTAGGQWVTAAFWKELDLYGLV